MPTLETQFRTALLNDATYEALVTGGTWLEQLPQNVAYPNGRIQRITTVPLYVHATGAGTPQASFGTARLQFDARSDDPQNAGKITDAIAQAVLNVLRTFNATGVGSNAPSFLRNRRAYVEPDTEPPIFVQILDIAVWYADQP